MMSKNAQKDPLSRLIESNPCPRCRPLKLPTCKCAPADGDDSEMSDDHGNTSNYDASRVFDDAATAASVEAENTNDRNWALLLQGLTNPVLSFQKVAALLNLDNDQQRGILTLQIKTGLTKEEQLSVRGFLHIVKLEFDQFKQKFLEKDIVAENFKAHLNESDLQLRIHIPSLNHYAAFLQHLVSKNLLPQAVLEQQSDLTHQSEKNSLYRTPFSTRPTPKNKQNHEELEKSETDKQSSRKFNPSPFSMKLKPSGAR